MSLSDRSYAFRTYSASEPAMRVARDLARNPVPFAVVRSIVDDHTDWYSIRVDEGLIRRLRAGKQSSLSRTLALRSLTSRVEISPRPGLHDLGYRVLTDATLLVDSVGIPRSLLFGSSSAATSLRSREAPGSASPSSIVYPHVECASGRYVDPGQTIEFSVSIDKTPQPGPLAVGFNVIFPDGADTLDLVAEVSSTEFAPIAGSAWLQTFTLNRQLDSTPLCWNFKALAAGDRPRYSLAIRFGAGAQTVGTVQVVLVRKGLDLADMVDAPFLPLPSQWGGNLRISVTRQGQDLYSFSCFTKDRLSCAPEAATFSGDTYFDLLENTTTLRDLQDLGAGLRGNLPESVAEFLSTIRDDATPVEIAGDGRVAPFEIVCTNPTDTRSFLGVRCPVMRWVGSRKPPAASLNVAVTGVACIRPEYKTDPLPSAKDEEAALATLFGKSLERMATPAELDNLLERTDVRLIHFAGHADGNPAQLSLQGGAVPAMRFAPDRPLVAQGRPFFFINGCRAGTGRADVPTVLGDFAKTLLRNGFVGVIAPTIKVQSVAALEVTRAFYEAAGDASVGEALRRARALVLREGVQDGLAASYVSYIACGPPSLALKFSR
jgi:hypothetical protein